jgi:H+/Cl- antiporter ClcA
MFHSDREVFVAHEDDENPMNAQRILKKCWRPVVGGVLGCVIGAVLGCVAGALLFGLYTTTFSQAELRHRYGEMAGLAMIQWGIRGIPVGGLVLGALGVWREIWLDRAGKGKS